MALTKLTGNTQRLIVDDGSGGHATAVTLYDAGVSVLSVLKAPGAANYANGQVATSTTAGTLIAARATRRSVLFRNLDATISVYIGAASPLTSSTGMLLKAGESVTVDTTALIQVIAASGTPTVAYVETYD